MVCGQFLAPSQGLTLNKCQKKVLNDNHLAPPRKETKYNDWRKLGTSMDSPGGNVAKEPEIVPRAVPPRPPDTPLPFILQSHTERQFRGHRQTRHRSWGRGLMAKAATRHRQGESTWRGPCADRFAPVHRRCPTLLPIRSPRHLSDLTGPLHLPAPPSPLLSLPLRTLNPLTLPAVGAPTPPPGLRTGNAPRPPRGCRHSHARNPSAQIGCRRAHFTEHHLPAMVSRLSF